MCRLVDDITVRKATDAADSATASAILGPFFRHDHPVREFGSTISLHDVPDGQIAYVHGTVTDAKTGKPIPNASIDVWQASTNGTLQNFSLFFSFSFFSFRRLLLTEKPYYRTLRATR